MGKKLKHKPLVEAIFEVRWGHPQTPQGVTGPLQFHDPHYQIMLGRLFDHFKQAGYDYYERLDAADIPEIFSGHVVQHRFRAGQNKWPLVQVGKGILTVNDVENYDWDKDFFDRCVAAVKTLHDKHPENMVGMPFQMIGLRYIDAYPFDFTKNDLFSFYKNKMSLDLGLPSRLLSSVKLSGNPLSFGSEFGYGISQPKGQLNFKTARGKDITNQRELVLWETEVRSLGEDVPKGVDGIASWLKASHEVTSAWFFELIKGDLEKEFE